MMSTVGCATKGKKTASSVWHNALNINFYLSFFLCACLRLGQIWWSTSRMLSQGPTPLSWSSGNPKNAPHRHLWYLLDRHSLKAHCFWQLMCFKIFYVFDINYPKQCAPAWEFLQQVVYGMEGPESNPKCLKTAIPNVRLELPCQSYFWPVPMFTFALVLLQLHFVNLPLFFVLFNLMFNQWFSNFFMSNWHLTCGPHLKIYTKDPHKNFFTYSSDSQPF